MRLDDLIFKKLQGYLTDDTVIIDENVFDYLWDKLGRTARSRGVIHFLRFSLLTECVVLHKRVLIPIYEYSDMNSFLYSVDRYVSIDQLIKNSLVDFIWNPYNPNDSLLIIDEIEDELKKYSDDPTITYSEIDEIDLREIVEDISGKIDLSQMTDPIRWHSYKTKLEPPWSNQQGIDRKVYQEVCKVLYKELKRLIKWGRPISLFIPPITATVLNSVFKKDEDYTDIVMQLREKYKKVREYFRTIDEIIKDEDLSISKQSRAQAKIAHSMNSIQIKCSKDDETYLSQLFSFTDLMDIIGNPVAFLDNPTKIVNYFLKTPIRKLHSRIKYRNTYFLFSLIKKYRNLENLSNMLTYLVGYKIPDKIINKLHSYINLTKDAIAQ